MPKCAFLSISNTEGWFIDDDLVHEPLKKLGWSIDNVPWNQKVDWDTYDLVVIRSPWDYQDHLEAFIQVLKKIDNSNAILLNPLETVLWNINKKYLFELEKKGIELVPTIQLEKLFESDITDAFQQFYTDVIIIKPMIGANADDTFKIHKNKSTHWNDILDTFHDRACMIQPFMKHIVSEGEFSLMFFEGKLSHSILKTVQSGDYRVQEEHGGGVVSIEEPEAALLQSAQKVMNVLEEIPFYARVDLVRTDQYTFAIMELELIEPCLYFRFDEHSPQAFAEAIHTFWDRNKEE